MGEFIIRTPGGVWMTHKEAVDYLGLPESQFQRLLRARLILCRGKGRGQRFRASDVDACGVLWERLEPLLPPAEAEPEE